MKNKILAMLLIFPILVLITNIVIQEALNHVSDADKIVFQHNIMNVIREGDTQELFYKVLPSKYTSDLVIESSNPELVEVIAPKSENEKWKILGKGEGEVELTASLKTSKALATDSIFFYCYNEDTDKILVYDERYNSQLIERKMKYGEYDFDKDFNKIDATFHLQTIDLSSVSDENAYPSEECEIIEATSNLTVTFIPSASKPSYKVTIHDDKDSNGNSYIKFGSKIQGHDTTEIYYVDVVDEAVNVRNYQDLLQCTNRSENGEKIVLQTHLESAQNTFMNYDINHKDKFIDVEKADKYDFTELFGSAGVRENGSMRYYMSPDDYVKIKSNYDTKFVDTYNDFYGSNINTDLIVGIHLKQDLYGNGFTINMHSLTYPNGQGTTTENGETNVKPIATDPFRGPIDFVGITLAPGKKYSPLASVAGQDNIGLLIDGDNIKVENVEIKSCNNVNYLSNLRYVGTTVEVIGNNVEIKNSLLQNGRVVLRSFSNHNLKVTNSLLRNGRDFIIKVGNNSNYFSESLEDVPTWSGDECFYIDENSNLKNSITLDNVYTQNSGFFSVGVDAHFNGSALINGYDPFLPIGNLGATSRGTEINIVNNTRFYDWKNIDELDTSTLIQINDLIASSSGLMEQIMGEFDIKHLIRKELVGENEKFMFKHEDEETSTSIEYVHGGIAFYGGGINYSKIIQNDESLLENHELDKLPNIALTGLLSQFAGTNPFNFYMYDNQASITPFSSPNINDLRENCRV